MVTLRWIVLLSFLSVAFLRAGEIPLGSRFEVQQHLLGGPPTLSLRPFSDAGQAPLQNKKSVGLSAIYSLLLPGMGELYAGNFASGKYFLGAEGALWLTYLTFEIYGNTLRDDARTYAVSHAGISTSGKDDQYFIDIGNFLDIDAYNDKKLRDRDPSRVYDPNAGYAWQWTSDAARATYKDQRISSENMYNNKKFVVAALIVNHVASAINAARAVISHNRDVENEMSDLRLQAGVLGGFAHPHGIVLTLTKPF